MGRYTQGIRLRAITAELAIARARWRWFFLGGLAGAAAATAVVWIR